MTIESGSPTTPNTRRMSPGWNKVAPPSRWTEGLSAVSNRGGNHHGAYRGRIHRGLSKTRPPRGAIPHSEPAARPVAVPPLPAAEPGDRVAADSCLRARRHLPLKLVDCASL